MLQNVKNGATWLFSPRALIDQTVETGATAKRSAQSIYYAYKDFYQSYTQKPLVVFESFEDAISQLQQSEASIRRIHRNNLIVSYLSVAGMLYSTAFFVLHDAGILPVNHVLICSILLSVSSFRCAQIEAKKLMSFAEFFGRVMKSESNILPLFLPKNWSLTK